MLLGSVFAIQKAESPKAWCGIYWGGRWQHRRRRSGHDLLHPPDAMGMRFQKDCAEPLDRIKKALRDMTFPFITSKYYSMTKTSAKPVFSNTSISMYFFHTISLLE
jgi:hypothetical protein